MSAPSGFPVRPHAGRLHSNEPFRQTDSAPATVSGDLKRDTLTVHATFRETGLTRAFQQTTEGRVRPFIWVVPRQIAGSNKVIAGFITLLHSLRKHASLEEGLR